MTTPAHRAETATIGARLTEWLLRRERLEAARARALDPVAAVHRSRLERARSAVGLADRTLESASEESAVLSRETHGVLLGLYTDATFWALAAFVPTDPPADLAQALANAPADLVLAAAGDDTKLDYVRAALVDRAHAEPPGFGDADLDADRLAVAHFVHALIETLDARAETIPGLMRQRWTRLAWVALAAISFVAALDWLVPRMRPDLAATAHWHASSRFGEWPIDGVGFHPPEGGPNVFFHTGDQMLPSVEFDLGSIRPVHYVWVRNRMDCCQDRAVPLLVEVSGDHRTWTRVARQDESFYDWDVAFPVASARYVRLSLPRYGTLHLGRVEIR